MPLVALFIILMLIFIGIPALWLYIEYKGAPYYDHVTGEFINSKVDNYIPSDWK